MLLLCKDCFSFFKKVIDVCLLWVSAWSCLFQVLLLSLCKCNVDAAIYMSDVWCTEAATSGGLWKKRLQHRSFSVKLRNFIRTPIFKLQTLSSRCNFIMESDSLLKSFLNNDSLQTCHSIFAGMSMRIISLKEPSCHDSIMA